jgi:hypothetical protein
MAHEQIRPVSKENAPDPSNTYERCHPENEAGQGRLDSDKPVPSKHSNDMEATVGHKQNTARQLNSEDVIDQRSTVPSGASVKPAAKK